MAVKVTYLFGAGASASVLPLVKDLPNDLYRFPDYFDYVWAKPVDDKFPDGFDISFSFSEVVSMFREDVKWLSKEASSHSSIDTLARKYYLSNKQFELTKLKIILNEYFIVKQLFRGIDMRYDSFFASILKGEKGNIEIPSNIKILNWNYDKQFEFSFGQFSASLPKNSINHDTIIEDVLQVFPRRKESIANKDRFSIIKLNGTFGGAIDDFSQFTQVSYNVFIQKDLTDKDKFGILAQSLRRYYNNIQNANATNLPKYSPTIYYSWEQNDHVNKIRQLASDLTYDTEILVVIGYSFPTFNRSLDKNLIRSMLNLKRVYIQNVPASIEGVIQRFKSITEFEGIVSPITSVDEFFIPYEFN